MQYRCAKRKKERKKGEKKEGKENNIRTNNPCWPFVKGVRRVGGSLRLLRSGGKHAAQLLRDLHVACLQLQARYEDECL